ncbi:hypothetical protein F5883DRAFT_620446 [Diaporthe sp. PMI_573]|nr:hypothetical protein F5883DRAFT_620446 [Diaporthaceae sp. PMI_573]
MTEAVAGLSLAANILQMVEYGGVFVTTAWKIYAANTDTDIVKDFKHLQYFAKDVDKVLASLEQDIPAVSSSSMDSDNGGPELVRLAKKCRKVTVEILEFVGTTGDQKSWKTRIHKAVKDAFQLTWGQDKLVNLPTKLDTPLNQVAQYEKVKFTEGLHGKRTRYSGFSQEADDAWHELQEDRKDYTMYAMGLWHDIHCVVTVCSPESTKTGRTAWDSMAEEEEEHLHHCLNYLRKVALCRGSLDLVAWHTKEDRSPSPKYNQTQVGPLMPDQLEKWGWQNSAYMGGVELLVVHDWTPVE